MNHTDTTTDQARQAFYDRIAPSNLTPLWEVISALVTPEPRTEAAAAVWDGPVYIGSRDGYLYALRDVP